MKSTSRNYWTESRLRKEAKKYRNRKAFAVGSAGAYRSAHRQGLIDIVCKHMGKPATGRETIYTPEVVTKLAKRFKTRSDFAVSRQGAYKAAVKYGILDRICKHMQTGERRKAISKEDILAIARKSKSLSDLREKQPRIYLAAYRRKMMAKVERVIGK